MAYTLPLGAEVTKKNGAQKVYAIDWTTFLAGLSINGSPAPAWSITCPDEASPTLTSDQAAIVGNITRIRITAGTPGKRYRVAVIIDFGSAPAQKEEGEFFVYVSE